ncbi:MAG: hypothetical protein U1E39_04415 [Planctomycetota bacterium]
MNRRAWLAAIVVASAACVVPAPAHAAGGAHPYFADNGALVWYRSLSEAQQVARASNKLIFIESGRLQCSQCRRLVSNIIPQEPIRSRMNAVAVGFADDCDDDGSPCKSLLEQSLPGATMLPLCGFVTADLRWVTGWYGSTTPGAVMQHLAIAEERCRRLAPAAAPAPVRPAPTPYVNPAPRPAPTPPPPAPTPKVAPPAPAVVPPPAPPKPTPFVLPAPTPATPAPMPYAAPAPVAPKATPFAAPAPATPKPAPFVAPAPATPKPAPFVAPAPAPAPKSPAAVRAATPIERARAAAVREQWGEVLRIAEDAREPSVPDGAEMSALVDRANQWVARTMNDAERYAGDQRPDAALRLLEALARELAGTIHPASVDAVRGQEAMKVLQQIAGASANAATADMLRRDAYARFRGSRWAPLFRSR